MNGLELGEAVATRLRTLIPSRTVYKDAVPNGTLPAQYLLVVTSEGDEAATRTCDTVNIQAPYVWVYSISADPLPDTAAWEAKWGAVEVRKALRNWRPEGTWRLRSLASIPAGRDDTTPKTHYTAIEQFRVRSHV